MSIVVSEDNLIVNEILTINGTESSTNNTTGALVVTGGGGGIVENLNIGGNLNIDGDVNITNTLTIGSGETSYSFPTESGVDGEVLQYTTSGSLIFTSLETPTSVIINSLPGECNLVKSLGTNREIEVTDIVMSNTNDMSGINNLSVDNNGSIGGDVIINSTTSSTSNTTGALVISGGIGITENLNISNNVCIDGNVKIDNILTLGQTGSTYSFPNETGTFDQVLFVNTGGALVFQTPNNDNEDDVLAPSVFGDDNRLIRTLGSDRDVEVTGVSISDTGDISGINTLNINNESSIGGTLYITSTTTSTSASTGAIIISGGVGIGENLNVGGDTNIDGVININNTTVSNDTTSGGLVIDGGVGIGGDVYIGGTLNGENLNFVDTDFVITSTTESTNNTSGALVVNGGVGIGDDVNIGGDTNIDGTLTINDPFISNSTLSSTNNTSGALIIAGGLGLAENLNMGGVLNVNNSTGSTDPETGALVIDGGAGINENLNVGGDIGNDGVFNINNTTNSTGTGTGALIITGGASINKDLYVGGSLIVDEPVINDSKFFNAVHTSTISVSSPTFVGLPWNTEIRKDGLLYTHSAGSSDVSVLSAGWYEITAEVATQIEAGDGGARTIGNIRITINGTPVTETDTFVYNRTAQRGHYTSNVTIIQDLPASAIINVEINRAFGTSTISSVSEGCRLLVSKI